MEYYNQEANNVSSNNMPNIPSSSHSCSGSSQAELPSTSDNPQQQNGKGAIKKTYGNMHTKKPRVQYHRNNHRFKNNEFKSSDNWKPSHDNYENSHSNNRLDEIPSLLNSGSQIQNFYQKRNKYNYDNNYNPNGYRSYYKHSNAGFKNDNVGINHSNQEYDLPVFYGSDNYQSKGGYSKNRQFRRNKPTKNNKNWRRDQEKENSTNKFDVASQRERLEEMIKGRTLECLVCCEALKPHNKVWSCKQCYHILHLKCTQAWANSSKIENGWRCPACQNVCKDIPSEYRCFCGKVKDPKNEPGLTPHSCGEICLREGRICEHRCLILCHPGPCPDCSIMVTKKCGCNKTEQQVKCSSDVEIICSNVCEKILECGLHQCKNRCHMGDCVNCDQILTQTCFCGKETREVGCTSEFKGREKYSCGGKCDKTLRCDNHKCEEICHEGSCKPCAKDVDLVRSCFCGKTPLVVERKSCLDPVPPCGLKCEKILKCGPPNAPHVCKSVCHDGECPPCDLTTMLKCRCGFMDKEISCQMLTTKADDARCEKKCTKKRLCGKHKCNQRCCIEFEHLCPLPCNRLLSCGNHRCPLTCHSGRCKPCTETGFDELYCECGSSVLYPPIPCGTKPPRCDRPCVRTRQCGHEVNHTCHLGACPPCTVLCKRWCYGGHEQRGTIPCHQENFSCGLPCGKLMPCGKHKCNKPCHLGSCPVPCVQPCVVERVSCGHPCLAPCHAPPCPETSCKSKVSIACPCGVQKGAKYCYDVADEMRSIEMALISEKMLNLSKNQTVDISDVARHKRPEVLKIMECTEECRVIERNRRLAIGLQIRNPDISQKLTPRYSDFMRGWAKKDPHFCQRIHDKLTELVQLAKQSKQKSRAYSFESMNRDKRHFVHEYCEHFGCESEAYDAEPNRNIVATALKDKSWLPGMSLLEVLQRENGQRKVPGPAVLDRGGALNSKSESVSLGRLSRNNVNSKFDFDK